MATHNKKKHANKKHKRKKPHIAVRLVVYASISAVFTFTISYLTRGYWEPMANIHFIEFATTAMAFLEDNA